MTLLGCGKWQEGNIRCARSVLHMHLVAAIVSSQASTSMALP